jgi:hypothetical protein
MFSDRYLADGVFREGESPPLLGRFAGACGRFDPSSLVFPVYRGRQDSFRVLPFDLRYDFGKFSLGSSPVFLVHEADG